MKTIWAISSCLFLLIIKYQSEKPKEEKSDFDYWFRNFVQLAFFVHFWFCMVYMFAIYIPIPLKEEYCIWIVYVSHCIFLLNFTSATVTIYIKMVMIFQPQDLEGSSKMTLSNKVFLWKLVILILALILDWTYTISQTSPILGILTKKTNVQA